MLHDAKLKFQERFMTTSSPHHPPTDRLHALDAVRALALFLGIVLHASMSFMSGPQIWAAQDVGADPVFNLFFFVPHIFRMTLFFFIAGLFARLAFNRRGAIGFSLDRMKRIVLPLVSFWMPVFAAIIAVFIWGAVKANGGEMPEGEAPPLTAQTFPLTHLWFLYLLLIFYAAALILRLPARLTGALPGATAMIDRIIGLIAASPLGLVVLAAPIAAWFWFNASWMPWFGIPTPDTGFVPNGGALTAYGVAFGFGWLVHRQTHILQSWRAWWPVYLGLAVALTAFASNKIGIEIGFMPMAQDTDKALYAASYAAAGWAWSIGIIGAAMHFWSGESAWRRYLADASYWVYLLHLPIVMALQVALYDVALPAPIKFVAILTVTMSVLLGSYQLLVRGSWLGAWLNGRRYPAKPAPQIPPATAQTVSPQA
jgi:glucan biosynthesis protein C